MLNYVWSGLVIISVLCSVFLGNTEDLSKALVDSGASSIGLIITMAGIICLWTGIMKIAVESGLTSVFAKIFSPLLRPLFPNLDKNSDAFKSISMNISANLLGLGNAATPLGITAMKALKEETPGPQSDTASHSMILFVLLNTASIQLLPTTVATLRLQNGSAVPMDILPAVLLTSFLSLLVALFGALCCKQTLRAKQHFTIWEV